MSFSQSGIPANLNLTVDETNLALASKQDVGNTTLASLDSKILPEGIKSVLNSTTTPLNAGDTFTGVGEQNYHPEILIAIKTDQDCSLYCDLSTDGVNWDSNQFFSVSADVHEVHRIVKAGRYVRVRIQNTSLSNQTYLRVGTYFGNFPTITSALNSAIQKDSDAIITRGITDETAIASGLFQDYSIVNKYGVNFDIRTSTVPEDIWGGGGLYTGFPDSTVETISVFSSSAADAAAGTGARTVRITGLDSNYNVQTEVITLDGITPVASVNTYRRLHTAQTITAGSGGVNAGTLTFRHTTTVANVFLEMQPGRNQTNNSAYTVPAGYTAYMRKITSACGQNNTTAIEGHIWTRAFGSVFRSRRPFFIGNTYRLTDDIFGGLVFTEKSDIIIRIVGCTSNSAIPVNGGYDLLLIKN